MGFLAWLFSKPKFNRYEDSFAMTRESLYQRLYAAVLEQQHNGQQVWIVAHFADTFWEVQNCLAQWQLDYEIVNQRLSSDAALQLVSQKQDQVQLVLAELLSPTDSVHRPSGSAISIAIIVVERHPWIVHDRQLEAFVRALPCPVRYGYYLSIDDVLVRRVVNETVVQVLKQLGMKDHELITSNLVTRRLEKVLTRDASSYSNPQRADSAAEWYELNDNA
jgi:hypothetical protein